MTRLVIENEWLRASIFQAKQALEDLEDYEVRHLGGLNNLV